MDDKEFQIKSLEAIYIKPSFAPIFKSNPRHCINEFARLTPYISCRDIERKMIVIRGCPIGCRNIIDSGKREIIASYSSINELVKDGWQLD